jgi:ketosteroid isomerase-like protein
MSAEKDVHDASKKFYAALNQMAKSDASLMGGIWSHGGTVTTMHPIGGRESGWGEVRKSFEEVAKLCSAGNVELRDQVVHVGGDIAYELGVEHGQITLAGHKVSLSHRVTNIYRKETGGWKIVHHHTDIAPAMLDVLNKLNPKT